MQRAVSISILLLLLAIPLSAQTAAPEVGEPAPDFELTDSTGKTHTLSDYRGKKAVVLEFFRSGDW